MATPPSRRGTDAWHIADHIILCPRSFTTYPVNIHDLDRTARQNEGSNGKVGTHIDTLDLPGTTLLHELHHVAHKDDSDDALPWFPKRNPDTVTGVISKEWVLMLTTSKDSEANYSQFPRVQIGFHAVSCPSCRSRCHAVNVNCTV